MTIPCPHCSAEIDIDPATHATLRDHSHFACPACQGMVPAPAKPRLQLNPAPGTRATAMAPPAHRPQKAATASRKTNRNMLILGATALLVLGGLAFFLAQRRSANTTTSTQNIRNEIINNSYFTQLIASGATTGNDLNSIAEIRRYGDGFIGISSKPLNWSNAQDLARRTGSVILGPNKEGDSDSSELLRWISQTFPSESSKSLWLAEHGEARVLANSEILAVAQAQGERRVLLHWRQDGSGADTSGHGGWTALFDGNDLSKWKGAKTTGFPGGAWTVENGSLRNLPGTNAQSLVTRESFRDFELEFEWKFSSGGNSGIFYGIREFQLVDDVGNPNGKVPVTSCGALCYFIAPNEKKMLQPVGEFNRGRLAVSGNHVEHWINGEKVVEYELGSPALKSLVASGRYRNLPGYREMDTEPGETPVSLQSHGGTVWFRNIRIRRLNSASPVDVLSDSEIGHFKQCGPGGIRIENGVGTTWFPAGGGSYGVGWYSKRKFADFVLKAEFRAVQPAFNSGLRLRFQAPGDDPLTISAEGYEIAICDTGDKTASRNPTGSVYDQQTAVISPLRPLGEWNALDVTVIGQLYTVTLNGVVVNRFSGNRLLAGYIGLENHNRGSVQFRNLLIKDL